MSKKLGLSWDTVKKWKASDGIEDISSRPHKLNTTLTKWQEDLILFERRQFKKPIDEIFFTLEERIPNLYPMKIYRCLRRYGLNILPQEFVDAERKIKKFRKYIKSVSLQTSEDFHWIEVWDSLFKGKEYLVYWFFELSPFKEDQILLPSGERCIKFIGTRRGVLDVFSQPPFFDRSPIEMVFFRQRIDTLLRILNFFPYRQSCSCILMEFYVHTF